MRPSTAFFCAVVAFAPPAMGADVSRLEWGAFIVEDDSSNGWKETRSVSADDGRSVTLSFEALEAKADGSTAEAASRISGYYNITQPGYDSYSMSQVSLEGHIIKGSAGVARLILNVGSVEKIIEWPAGTSASEKFTRTVEFIYPGDGRLPNPFVVGIQAYARKEASGDASYVSVNSMTITAGSPKVAQGLSVQAAGEKASAGMLIPAAR